MARARKVKIVVHVSPPLVARYRALADRFGLSMSEVYRYALQHGFGMTASWCRRTAEPFPLDDPAGVVASSTERPVEGGPPDDALAGSTGSDADLPAALRWYAEAVLVRQPDVSVEEFRTILTAHGGVLALRSAVLSALVDEIVAAHFVRR